MDGEQRSSAGEVAPPLGADPSGRSIGSDHSLIWGASRSRRRRSRAEMRKAAWNEKPTARAQSGVGREERRAEVGSAEEIALAP